MVIWASVFSINLIQSARGWATWHSSVHVSDSTMARFGLGQVSIMPPFVVCLGCTIMAARRASQASQ